MYSRWRHRVEEDRSEAVAAMSAHVCADRRERLLSLLVLGVLAQRDAWIPDRYI